LKEEALVLIAKDGSYVKISDKEVARTLCSLSTKATTKVVVAKAVTGSKKSSVKVTEFGEKLAEALARLNEAGKISGEKVVKTYRQVWNGAKVRLVPFFTKVREALVATLKVAKYLVEEILVRECYDREGKLIRASLIGHTVSFQ